MSRSVNLTPTEARRRAFGDRLADPRIVVAPGVYDTLGSLFAEQAGFEAVFFSGSAFAFSQLGQPDLGLVTPAELVTAVERAAERVSIPVLVDIDSGFGGAPQAARLLRALERAGACGVQVEDQAVVKPDTDLLARPLVTVEAMVGKLRAMLDARESGAMLVSARSDARDPSEAVDRCLAYYEAGADLIFPEGMTDRDAISRLMAELGPEVPVVFNTIHDAGVGADPVALQALGYRVALYPGVAVQHGAAALRDCLARLKADPAATAASSPLPAKQLTELLGAKELLARFVA